jgi:hypothetical protein
MGYAGTLMAIGIWLHLTEHHEHEHFMTRTTSTNMTSRSNRESDTFTDIAMSQGHTPIPITGMLITNTTIESMAALRSHRSA